MRPPIAELTSAAFETIQNPLFDDFNDGYGYQIPVIDSRTPGDVLNIIPGEEESRMFFDLRNKKGEAVVVFEARKEHQTRRVIILPVVGYDGDISEFINSAFTETGLNDQRVDFGDRSSRSFFDNKGDLLSDPLSPIEQAA